jgi:predicted restriction endonuclease
LQTNECDRNYVESAFSIAFPKVSAAELNQFLLLRQTQNENTVIRAVRSWREDLLKAYDSKCAITGWDAQEALEAAHIIPYSETENNHLSNGLLLRADLHTLFDLNLISIDPHTDPDERKVRIAPSLRNTEYRKLEGISLRQPNNQAYLPKKEFLDEHCKQCWWYRLPPEPS